MSELDYGEVLGVESTGSDVSSSQEISPNNSAPADCGSALSPEESPDSPDAGTAEKSTITPQQSKEERAVHAAERRRRETAAAISKARAEGEAAAKEKYDKLLRELKIPNPIFPGTSMTSAEDLSRYKDSVSTARFNSAAKQGKLTPEDFEAMLKQTPTAKKIEQLAKRADEDMRQAQFRHIETKVNEEIAEISKLDPNIRSVSDLMAMPNYRDFYALVKKGNNFIDSYKLANFQSLINQRQNAAQQQALNSARSKTHLTGTTARGQGAVPVPEDEISLYRELNPGMSDAEIQRHYNSYIKSR